MASAAELAAHQAVANAPPVAFESRPDFGHVTVPIVAGAVLTLPLPVMPSATPQSDEPPLAEEMAPAAIPETTTPSASPVVTSAASPLPGLLPFNFAAIETGVRQVLDRVNDLDQVLGETPATTEDYLWLAAATLVAGGVAQAAWTQRSRPTDPRTLGLDSVLARWGEKYVG